MSRKYFGTDGVRGRVGESPITPELVMHLGYAAGRVLAAESSLRPGETPAVLIGKDTRISGYLLEAALEAGLSAAGVDVYLSGPLPTPAVAYLTRALRLSAGIVISASHNPFEDNGIKFFSATGTKLPDAIEQEIERGMEKPITCVKSASLGKARRLNDAAGRYIEFCKGTFPNELDLKGMKIVVDCAHGAGYHVAPPVFHELGAEVIAIGNEPDGLNINAGVGATHPKHLQEAVVKHGADIGLALDGDGDRLMMVDAEGRCYDGDQLLYVIALDYWRRGAMAGGIVGTLMSNLGLEQALAQRGIPLASRGGRRPLRAGNDAREALAAWRRKFRTHHLSRQAYDRRRDRRCARGVARAARAEDDARRGDGRRAAVPAAPDQRADPQGLRLARQCRDHHRRAGSRLRSQRVGQGAAAPIRHRAGAAGHGRGSRGRGRRSLRRGIAEVIASAAA